MVRWPLLELCLVAPNHIAFDGCRIIGGRRFFQEDVAPPRLYVDGDSVGVSFSAESLARNTVYVFAQYVSSRRVCVLPRVTTHQAFEFAFLEFYW